MERKPAERMYPPFGANHAAGIRGVTVETVNHAGGGHADFEPHPVGAQAARFASSHVGPQGGLPKRNPPLPFD
jgi:hypothetical protein